ERGLAVASATGAEDRAGSTEDRVGLRLAVGEHLRRALIGGTGVVIVPLVEEEPGETKPRFRRIRRAQLERGPERARRETRPGPGLVRVRTGQLIRGGEVRQLAEQLRR